MNEKIYVKDLKRGMIYKYTSGTFRQVFKEDGLVQYLGPSRHNYEDGSSWKTHKFLWIKKPIKLLSNKRDFQGDSFLNIFGDEIRGKLKRYQAT